jgi:hypothetical protein
MHIENLHEYIQELTNSLPKLFSNITIDFSFGLNRPLIGDWSDENNLGILAGDNVGDKSGLYIFTTSDHEIVYIGKATKNNLHHRVWDHVKTPQIMHDGWRNFPKTLFKSCNENSDIVLNAREGRLRLYVFTVSDPYVTSLIEVYLQIQHIKLHNRLPAFNKQIG